LSFAGLSPEKIRRGIAMLGKLFEEELERLRQTAYEPAPALV